VVIVLLSAAFARRLPARRVLLAVLVTAIGTAFVGSGEGGSASISGDLLVAAVAFSLYNWALSQVSTVAAGVSLTLIPVFGLLFSATLLSEPIRFGHVGRRRRGHRRGRRQHRARAEATGSHRDGHHGRSAVSVI
jgi:drug/metabolite transporter (DMT)-like permease